MLVHQHAAELGEPVRWVVERGEDDRPLVDHEAEQSDLVSQGALEPVGELVATLWGTQTRFTRRRGIRG